MRRVVGCIVRAVSAIAAVLLLSGFGLRAAEGAAANPTASTPVFIELFTSEGCSSCPPADDLLAEIAQKIPNVVVLSEHVTYWNQDGWTDPFSSSESTDRQADYVFKLGLKSSYTPEMVVDGKKEFIGSDARAATEAIKGAMDDARVPVSISGVTAGADRRVSFEVATGPVRSGSVLFVVATQDEGTKHVSTGENGGHTLRHVMIARSFTQAAKIKSGGSYSGHLSVKLPEAVSGSGWHLVAFVQQGRGGPVIGAASAAVPGEASPSVRQGQ
jgi:hypothetical protein